VDAPRHVMLIPAKVIIEKMKSFDLMIDLCTTNDEGGLGWNHFGWEQFFSNLFTHKSINKALRMTGRCVAKLLMFIEQKEGRGSAYTMVFRKVK
jgi:hypothetical protein